MHALHIYCRINILCLFIRGMGSEHLLSASHSGKCDMAADSRSGGTAHSRPGDLHAQSPLVGL